MLKYISYIILSLFLLFMGFFMGRSTYQPKTEIEYIESHSNIHHYDTIYIFTNDTSFLYEFECDIWELDRLIENHIASKIRSFNFHMEYFEHHRFMTEHDFYRAIERIFFDDRIY